MKQRATLAVLYLLFLTNAYCQEMPYGQWMVGGDTTRLTLPPSLSSTVLITKGLTVQKGISEFFRIQPSHSPHEFVRIVNGTEGTMFIPVLMGYGENKAGPSLVFSGVTNPENDLTSSPAMMRFEARVYSDHTLSAGFGPILNRPLFAWRNGLTVHMQMMANGNLGIGTKWPKAQLHATGNVRFSGLAESEGNAIVMTDTSGELSRYRLPANTSIGLVSTTALNAVSRFDKTGSLAASQLFDNGVEVGIGGPPTKGTRLTLYGSMKRMSDARAKTDVVRMSNALQKVNALNGYYYGWKNQPGGREAGFLAQEVEQVLPEAVSENSEGTKFLDYNGVVPLLTEAIKEQQKLIQSQSALIEQLRREVDALKRKR